MGPDRWKGVEGPRDAPPTQPSPTRGEGLNRAPPSLAEEVFNLAPSPLVGEGWGGGAGTAGMSSTSPIRAHEPSALVMRVILLRGPPRIGGDRPIGNGEQEVIGQQE